jgi:hypothetical protein
MRVVSSEASDDAGSEVTGKIFEIMNRPDGEEIYKAFGIALAEIPQHLVPAATEALRKIAEGS